MPTKHSKSDLWYWILLFLPSLATLLGVMREYALGPCFLILALASTRVAGVDENRSKVIGEFTLVAAVATLLYRFASIRWMYPMLFEGEAEFEAAPNQAIDIAISTSFAATAALWFASVPSHLSIAKRVLGTIGFTLLVYPVLGHWAWGRPSGVWISYPPLSTIDEIPFLDFAGGTVIYGAAGWSALAFMFSLGSPATHEPTCNSKRWWNLVIPLLLWISHPGYYFDLDGGVGDTPAIFYDRNLSLEDLYVANLRIATVVGMCMATVMGRVLFGQWDLRYLGAGLMAGVACVTSIADSTTNLQTLLAVSFTVTSSMLVLFALKRLTSSANDLDYPVALAAGGTIGTICAGFLPMYSLSQQLLGIAICIGLSAPLGVLGLVLRFAERKSTVPAPDTKSL